MKQLFTCLLRRLLSFLVLGLMLTGLLSLTLPEQVVYAEGEQQVEALNRGLVAVKSQHGIFLSWRLLGTEDKNTTFHIYRDGQVIAGPIENSTNYFDSTGTTKNTYYIRTLRNGVEHTQSESVTPWNDKCFSIPLETPSDVFYTGSTSPYEVTSLTAAEVDEDGQYEILLRWTPTVAKESILKNSSKDKSLKTTPSLPEFLDCYKLNGLRKWRVPLTEMIPNTITQILAYDLKGTGYAQIVILTNESITLLDGTTGAILTSLSLPSTLESNSMDCVDNSTLRASVTYLNGKTPSLVICNDTSSIHQHYAYVYKANEFILIDHGESICPSNMKKAKDGLYPTLSPLKTDCSTPVLFVDLLGDWRDETIEITKHNTVLQIKTNPILTKLKFSTPMHNITYRCHIANQSNKNWNNFYLFNLPVHHQSISHTPVYTVGTYSESPVYGVANNVVREGIYYIKNAYTGQYLELREESGNFQIHMEQHRNDNKNTQKFKILSQGDGYYYILTGISNYNDCLEVEAGDSVNGTKIIPWLYHGGDMQMFHIVKNSDATYSFLTKASSNTSAIELKLLPDPYTNALEQGTYQGKDTQHWYLERADESMGQIISSTTLGN